MGFRLVETVEHSPYVVLPEEFMLLDGCSLLSGQGYFSPIQLVGLLISEQMDKAL